MQSTDSPTVTRVLRLNAALTALRRLRAQQVALVHEVGCGVPEYPGQHLELRLLIAEREEEVCDLLLEPYQLELLPLEDLVPGDDPLAVATRAHVEINETPRTPPEPLEDLIAGGWLLEALRRLETLAPESQRELVLLTLPMLERVFPPDQRERLVRNLARRYLLHADLATQERGLRDFGTPLWEGEMFLALLMGEQGLLEETALRLSAEWLADFQHTLQRLEAWVGDLLAAKTAP